jgi:hypothetical protein
MISSYTGWFKANSLSSFSCMNLACELQFYSGIEMSLTGLPSDLERMQVWEVIYARERLNSFFSFSVGARNFNILSCIADCKTCDISFWLGAVTLRSCCCDYCCLPAWLLRFWFFSYIYFILIKYYYLMSCLWCLFMLLNFFSKRWIAVY